MHSQTHSAFPYIHIFHPVTYACKHLYTHSHMLILKLTYLHTQTCAHMLIYLLKLAYIHTVPYLHAHTNIYTVTYSLEVRERTPQLSNQSTASKKYFLCIHFCATCIMGLLCWSNEKLSKKKGPGFCQALYWLHLPWNSVLLGDEHLHWPSWWPWEKPWAERLEQGSDQLVMAAVVMDPSQGPGVWSDR